MDNGVIKNARIHNTCLHGLSQKVWQYFSCVAFTECNLLSKFRIFCGNNKNVHVKHLSVSCM